MGMPEHIKIELPDLARLDAEIDGLEDRARDLKFERQKMIDVEAQKVAKLSVGDEIEKGKRRYKISSVGGDYVVSEFTPTPIIWVRYRGQRMFKNGNLGREEGLYLPTSL